jgi:hypothetical protein
MIGLLSIVIFSSVRPTMTLYNEERLRIVAVANSCGLPREEKLYTKLAISFYPFG